MIETAPPTWVVSHCHKPPDDCAWHLEHLQSLGLGAVSVEAVVSDSYTEHINFIIHLSL